MSDSDKKYPPEMRAKVEETMRSKPVLRLPGGPARGASSQPTGRAFDRLLSRMRGDVPTSYKRSGR